MSYIVPLFDEAWEHRRRRRRVELLLAALCAAAVGAYALIPRGAGPAHPRRTTGDPAAVAPGHVLARPPYMGVHCRVANSIACDEIGLAVWLKRPATAVTARIAGRPLRLNLWGDLPAASHAPRRAFAGFLQHAGIVSRMHVRPVDGTVVVRRRGRWVAVNRPRMWYGDARQPWPTPRVTLTIRYPGRTVTTRLRVRLSTGWG
jgi:hypothetical protein